MPAILLNFWVSKMPWRSATSSMAELAMLTTTHSWSGSMSELRMSTSLLLLSSSSPSSCCSSSWGRFSSSTAAINIQLNYLTIPPNSNTDMMENWKKNLNKLNGITIKHSDMDFELKDKITKKLAQFYKNENVTLIKVSKLMTEDLNHEDPTKGWVCLIGKMFIANISHEPRKFIKMVYRNYSFLVYKSISMKPKIEESKSAEKPERA